ncbi:PLP-dependent transferase [Tothia fuscella]|uniref:PLP-dependent transferase n=1 Tax=Tothia fuscella TaxID=1048955 RepID=A0A9P4TVE4_9PEZI|nr:PLP-dependent transferase [Tothia fuscella]
MLYGPDWGDERLRVAIASWLSDFYNPAGSIHKDRITVTGGASQNLGCILQTFTDPEYTRNIWIVSPAYMLAFRIFDDSGFSKKLRAVPEDEEGVDIEFLRREIKKSEDDAMAKGNTKPLLKPSRPWSKMYKHIIYAVPTFSNPSSKTMTLRRREELVRIARDYDALIVTDDVYDQLQWPPDGKIQESASSTSVVPRIVDVDRTHDGGAERDGGDGFGNAASNGSFSKILGPGVRTGWCPGTKKFAYGVSQTGTSRSGGAPSHLVATFIATLLEQGKLQNHITKTLQPTYARRFRTLMSAIQKHLVPLGVSLPQTDRKIVGGYFVWLDLPTRINAPLLSRRARDTVSLIVAEGALFQVPGDKTCLFPYSLRLCFAWEEEEKLEEGITRLADVLKAMLAEPEGINSRDTRRVKGQAEDESKGKVDGPGRGELHARSKFW